MNTIQTQQFSDAFETVQIEVHQNAIEHGWWDDRNPNDAEKIALMHSELSECLEALRECKGSSDHIPQFQAIEEELADVIIRIMDYSQFRKLDVAGAILAKMHYNSKREYKHGKSF